MKIRNSVDKNNWGSEREDRYFNECQYIAYTRKEKLEHVNGCIYIIENHDRKLLCKPVISSKVWYETWLKYK